MKKLAIIAFGFIFTGLALIAFGCSSIEEHQSYRASANSYSYIETIVDSDRGKVFRYLRVPTYAVREQYIISSEIAQRKD